MYDFLPDSRRTLGSLDMLSLCDRPRVAVPRRDGSRVGRAGSALSRLIRTIGVAPTRAVAAPPVPQGPAVVPA